MLRVRNLEIFGDDTLEDTVNSTSIVIYWFLLEINSVMNFQYKALNNIFPD